MGEGSIEVLTPEAVVVAEARRSLTTLSLYGYRVDGVLATADILDDLVLLGALEDKVVFSSFNRGGLAGARFELDDRMTGATAASTAAAKMNRKAPVHCLSLA